MSDYREQQARQHYTLHLPILRSINNVGRILSLTIIYNKGNKIGNAHLKWAFSVAVLYLRGNDKVKIIY